MLYVDTEHSNNVESMPGDNDSKLKRSCFNVMYPRMVKQN